MFIVFVKVNIVKFITTLKLIADKLLYLSIMNKKLYQTTRHGALGALMDLYEQEAELLLETINNKLPNKEWAVIKDARTKDEDCRSYQTICQHIISAAKHYVELLTKGENPTYEMKKVGANLTAKNDFEPAFRAVLTQQAKYFENRWDMSDEAIEAIVIKTGWGPIMNPETLLEHAVLHIMRHHRQLLKFIERSN